MRFNHQLWGEVVPDGPDFCHWGGRCQSGRLLNMYSLTANDRVLEVCCGYGGTLGLLPLHIEAYGAEISANAAARAYAKGLQVAQADAFSLPFRDEVFTHILSQDADAWMGAKEALAGELRRVTQPGGLLTLQTYARSATMPQTKIKQISRILSVCGYTVWELPVAERIESTLQSVGWQILKRQSLHALYSEDNRRMLRVLERRRRTLRQRYPRSDVRALEALLKEEKPLFTQHFWTGLLIVARAL